MTKKILKFKKITTILLTLSILLMALPAITTTASAVADITTMTVSTPQDLQDALNNPDVTTIIIQDCTIDISGCSLTIRSDTTLIVEADGRLDNYESVIINFGVIDNRGLISNNIRNAVLDNRGIIDNNGIINIFVRMDNSGTINNWGRINNSRSIHNQGIINNYVEGMLVNNLGNTLINNTGIINNRGIISNSGAFPNSGTIYSCSGTISGNAISDAIFDHVMNEGEVTTIATCEIDGEKTFTCISCGETKKEVISALGHDWDEGKITIPPTHKTEGEMTYTCKRCDETYTEVIPKLAITITIGNGDDDELTVDIGDDGVGRLTFTQDKFAAFLAHSTNGVLDLSGLSSAELTINVGALKGVDRAITIVTDDGVVSVNTKTLWNNSGKERIVTVENGKISFKNA
jgi:transcription elongation factor Elf1